jgi:hypothetical protein
MAGVEFCGPRERSVSAARRQRSAGAPPLDGKKTAPENPLPFRMRHVDPLAGCVVASAGASQPFGPRV